MIGLFISNTEGTYESWIKNLKNGHWSWRNLSVQDVEEIENGSCFYFSIFPWKVILEEDQILKKNRKNVIPAKFKIRCFSLLQFYITNVRLNHLQNSWIYLQIIEDIEKSTAFEMWEYEQIRLFPSIFGSPFLFCRSR